MTSHTRKSFVWLWMAALLSATFGMSVQQVYCYCTGKTSVSIFTAEEDCQKKKQVAPETDCCLKKTSSVKKSCCQKSSAEKRGCTKKTTQVIQLRTEFEVASSAFKKLDTPKIWALSLPPSDFLPFSYAVQIHDFQGYEQPPPLLSGRMICVRHGVFRC